MRLNHGFQISQVVHVFGHVSGKNLDCRRVAASAAAAAAGKGVMQETNDMAVNWKTKLKLKCYRAG